MLNKLGLNSSFKPSPLGVNALGIKTLLSNVKQNSLEVDCSTLLVFPLIACKVKQYLPVTLGNTSINVKFESLLYSDCKNFKLFWSSL